jgi:hypothetical protein
LVTSACQDAAGSSAVVGSARAVLGDIALRVTTLVSAGSIPQAAPPNNRDATSAAAPGARHDRRSNARMLGFLASIRDLRTKEAEQSRTANVQY